MAAHIYEVTKGDRFQRDRSLMDQMRRAAVSVMSNIAEGFERRYPKDFARFLRYAKASCAETRSQVYLAKDIGYLDTIETDALLEESGALARMIGTLLVKVARH
jgi:four helix bundle protein